MVEKNKKKEQAKAQRVWFDMNTGTKTHATKKHPNRNENKKDFKKMLDNIDY